MGNVNNKDIFVFKTFFKLKMHFELSFCAKFVCSLKNEAFQFT